jgi:antitoxin component YwqK of YwqJK toxin-antitoxin module
MIYSNLIFYFSTKFIGTTLQKTYEMIRKVAFSTLVFVGFIACTEANKPAAEEVEEKVGSKAQSECVPMNEIRYEKGKAYDGDRLFSGKVCSFHSNGNKHTLTSYKEGEKSGLWEVFFADGQREKSGFTRQGKDDGLYREWYPSGQLKYEYHYDLGKKVDVWKSWYEDGTRYTERHFKDDQLNGKVFVWDERGKLSKEYDYVNGQLMNSEMHFKEEGF